MIKKQEILRLLNRARWFHNYLCDEKETIKICNKILKEYPENRDALLIKAGSLSSIDEEKESFRLITRIIKKWPNHWEAYYLLGLLLFNTNEEIAMKNLIKSINLEKTFDNNIAAAQLAYFMQEPSYGGFLKCAKKIEPARYSNYMKNFWEWEIC